MVSLLRTLRSARRVGLKEWWRQMQYIGDAKSGTYIGKDQFGNRYYENRNAEEEIPGRHRWVDYAQHFYQASQVPPEWHSWIQHIRKDPPTQDSIMQSSRQPWQQEWTETLTGTRGAYKPYNTAAPKINAWEPKVTSRG
ncbi:NADH ubiquinone oxidoreductase subunit NDUFA12-domain-containing protein [Desarmillaria tabescens]|uniref:NADH dehydrogenase [ubiquinone] 1 alpha subcomplex subunit n=1 Tax=Armillaria tabescens TaxID=1929756 RepID=A0AA39TVW7_ARMTA|nr:NADH ubiquinone oxidoreductase subunit NDUFA12-domain-containing protein [Desarmillaria tabescens]KAK0467968.1 NADH ubiquinone oxidoreductase subunit NDUFA12-domain-containing protein [Desarmillaria tabescens]